ncbi:post-GPI attachment to proteins factor 2-like protein [Dinothrombium tinctorium]|uniref:Post-GPI attachment to proteins factor 2-like protein n=1 Tax=Dinothrombium tinctorium TaxID=1965070 RepID=A0A443RQG1_9ACAR|nr:post-GPI attachment to proteins factor 2-like protein [Dinothrombium tinctorium]RWS17514.1 post-GPI attachment to proteins factor 2-like protein [Dinothrombium tinctorium]RWS17526.1 post-GPI attachment to proteins factor 2-like protein [Dinothrombium tinctorium]
MSANEAKDERHSLLFARRSFHLLSLSSIAVITVLLPFCSFVLCVFWSLIDKFDASTSTHCNVLNFLPSVSAAIGAFSPQKYIWKFAIALHTIPRYFLSVTFFSLKHRSPLALIFNLIEITALLALSLVTSIENYAFHSKCFVLFVVSSILHMIALTSKDFSRRKAHRKYLLMGNTAATIFAVYFFLRHNWFCEPGMYSLFAFCEYVVVVTNMAFHFQIYYDLKHIDCCLLQEENHFHI